MAATFLWFRPSPRTFSPENPPLTHMYFEGQEGVSCARHAANNLLGSRVFEVERFVAEEELMGGGGSFGSARGERGAREGRAAGLHLTLLLCCRV